MPLTYDTLLFFDLDGTIMVNPFGSAVGPALLAELTAKTGLPAADIQAQIDAENAARQADDACPAVLAMDWDDIAATVARRLGVRLEADLAALVRQYAASDSRVLDDAPTVLRALRRPGRGLLVATKGLAKYQQPVLDALGLTPLFDAILTPDVYQGLKKHRRYFGDWPERARLAVMIGDMYDDDVLYPVGHGLTSIWKQPRLPEELTALDPQARAVAYPWAADQPARPAAIIRTLAELPALIAALEG